MQCRTLGYDPDVFDDEDDSADEDGLDMFDDILAQEDDDDVIACSMRPYECKGCQYATSCTLQYDAGEVVDKEGAVLFEL